MITLIEFIIAFPIAVLTTLLVAELLLGTLFLRDFSKLSLKRQANTELLPKDIATAVLIPAHNEEDVIANTLINLKKSIGAQDVIVVVADNCSDDTSKICKGLGVIVLERSNTQELGKGYALEHGRKWILENLDVEAVVLFDADCEFKGDSFKQLVNIAHARGAVCQSCYLMKSKGKAPKTIVAELTWWLKNAVRPLGHKKLGMGTQIQGSGIAFPVEIFNQISLASGSIVEDLELGLNLSMSGMRVFYCESSLVESYFPENTQGLAAQRTRWEHGHLSILNKLPRLMFKSLTNGDFKSVGLLLDAAIPPLFSFILLQMATLFIGALVYILLDAPLLLNTMLFCVVATYSSLLLVWLTHGYKIVGLNSITLVIKFFLSKFSIYVSFITRKQAVWEKTTRDKE